MNWNDPDAVAAMLAAMPDQEAANRNRERMDREIAKQGEAARRGMTTLDTPAVYDVSEGDEQTPAKTRKRAENGAQTAGTGKRRGNPEARLIADTKKLLESHGYRVYRVGQWRADYSGSDAGVPDLIAVKPNVLTAVLLEAKVPGGVVSQAQAIGAAEGYIHIVQTPVEALEVVEAIEREKK